MSLSSLYSSNVRRKEKINILFIASNPDIIFTDEQGKLREQQKLSLDNAYI